MKVSKSLKELARYVLECPSDERAFALCVFTDVALSEGTKDAERFCVQVLARHLRMNSETEVSGDGAIAGESDAFALKVTVNQLTELTERLDRRLDHDLLVSVVKEAMKLMQAETDKGIRSRLTGLLTGLGVPLDKIPSSQLSALALTTLFCSVSMAA